MNIDGRFRKGFLGELISSRVKTPDGLSDMRKFDWCSTHIEAPCYYYEDSISMVDFSYSKCEKCFFVYDATFVDCNFDNSMWWFPKFRRCKFFRCSFNNCRLYSTLLDGKFYDCSFNGLYAKGEEFNFGLGSVFKNCSLESVNLNNMFDQGAVRFEDCVISGTFRAAKWEAAHFLGSKRKLKVLLNPILRHFSYDRIFRFIRCDLTGLKTHNVVFDENVIFEDCKGMPSKLEK